MWENRVAVERKEFTVESGLTCQQENSSFLVEPAGHGRLSSLSGVQGKDLVCHWLLVFAVDMNYNLLRISNMADFCPLSLGCFNNYLPNSFIFSIMANILNGLVRKVE